MASTSWVYVECDRCQRPALGDETWAPVMVPILRELLAEVGWRSDAANDRDLCPQCVLAVDAEAGGAWV